VASAYAWSSLCSDHHVTRPERTAELAS